MRLLCRLGLHRWDFRTRYESGPHLPGLSSGIACEITEARCRHRCERYADWAMVNREWRETKTPSDPYDDHVF